MSAQNSITVERKNVYGNDLIYPVDKKAILFSVLINKKTFSTADLIVIEELGFNINYLLK